jgi:multidrug efflux system outer membrane protein
MIERTWFNKPCLALAMALSLAACNFAPKYERPHTELQRTWAADASLPAAPQQDIPWESLYTDERLRALIRLSLTQNHDLRLAVARMEEARAQWGVQRADQLPGVNASVGRVGSLTPAGVANTPVPFHINRVDASLSLLSFELDFWGRVANLTEAARRNYEATAEDRRVIHLGLISDVANAYFLLLESEQRASLLARTVQTRERHLNLSQRRRDAGAASDLDVSLAQGALANAQSDEAAMLRQREQARNALTLLVGGRLPADLPRGLPLASQNLGLQWGANLSSEVLLRRPDVLAAEQRLMAAHANIGVARAAFLPRMQLTGAVGSASTGLGGLFDSGSRTWSFTPSLQQPLFDGGRNASTLDMAQARQVQAVVQYEKALQQAFREVADLLVARDTLQQQLAALQAWSQSQQARLRLTEARYTQGAVSQLELLDAQRDALTAEQTQVQALRQLLGSTAQLYKALGGGAH